MSAQALRVGIGGPVGSGKTALTLALCRALRDRYQYFTEARTERLRAAGFPGQFTPLEEGVRRYVQNHLEAEDPYR